MARPIEYDLDDVVEKAMEVFWRTGLEGTPVRELARGTQLNTRTMYNLFGSKEGLFRAALERYRATRLTGGLDLLKQGGVAAIGAFLGAIAGAEAPNGCLLVNTLCEGSHVAEDDRAFVRRYFSELEGWFVKRLGEARAAGEFEGNVASAAKMLVLVTQGLGVQGRAGVSAAERTKAVKAALSLLAPGA